MAVSRAILGLIALLAVLATLWITGAASIGGHGAASRAAPSGQALSNAISGAQSAVQQANADAQRAAGTSAGGTPSGAVSNRSTLGLQWPIGKHSSSTC